MGIIKKLLKALLEFCLFIPSPQEILEDYLLRLKNLQKSLRTAREINQFHHSELESIDQMDLLLDDKIHEIERQIAMFNTMQIFGEVMKLDSFVQYEEVFKRLSDEYDAEFRKLTEAGL